MSFAEVKLYFENKGLADRVIVLEKSSATVELAAQALGCEPKQIAKSMSFLIGQRPVLVVTAGDAKVDNKKFKETFHQKSKMMAPDLVQQLIGHAPGGVCPFAVLPAVEVYLDVSLKRFERVFPAAGNDHSAVDLTLQELESHSNSIGWVDVCKAWQADDE